jgi:hypothetical protein
MRSHFCFLTFIFLLSSCSDREKMPDLSGIKVSVPLIRFEQAFFKGDSVFTASNADELDSLFGSFFPDFLYGVLNVPHQSDSALYYTNLFRNEYLPIQLMADKKFGNFKDYYKQLIEAFRLIKYYFPSYALPPAVITFIGPTTGYMNILTQQGMAIGLQGYMGTDASIYQNPIFLDTYPSYMKRRFSPEFLVADAVRNLVDEITAAEVSDATLLSGMITAGKKAYLLSRFLPNQADSILTGYTQKQLQGCYDNEQIIWDFFLRNSLLYQTDPQTVMPFLHDAPNTPELGMDSPGNIGLFVGWQIVKKWMAEQSATSLQMLVSKPYKELFTESKYKP